MVAVWGGSDDGQYFISKLKATPGACILNDKQYIFIYEMESARRMANKHGGRRYRGRVFGGGFVFQVYGLDLLIDELYNDIYKKDR